MKNFLVNLLWVQSGCNCGGKQKFKKQELRGIEITLFRAGSYEIRDNNQVVNRGMSHQLETEYNKLFA